MRIEIYEEKQKEQVLRLRLVARSYDNSVALVAVDDNGITLSCGYILSIQEDGTLHLHYNIDDSIGLKLGAFNEIAIAS